jgi:anti-sigma B factor antagonist
MDSPILAARVESDDARDYVIAIAGELDLASSHVLAAALVEAELTRPRRLTVDLRDLTFIDGAGIRVLLAAARRAAGERRMFLLAHPDPGVRRVFEVTGTDGAFNWIERTWARPSLGHMPDRPL